MRRPLAILAATAAALTALAAAALTVDRWLFVVLDPGPFDPARTPPAPDYTTSEAWAARPETLDGADVAVAAWPARDQTSSLVDVFYIHPTTSVARAWNAPWDDPTVVAATERGGTLIQASVFNACCAVYAPRYRQASGLAFVRPDSRGQQASDVAQRDVSAAFDAFLQRTGDRGFVIAGHSQGTMLATRLLRERVAGTPLQDRLVVAYLIGGAIGTEDLGGVPPCRSRADTGCVVAWNARGPAHELGGLEFDADDPDTLHRRLCTNPLAWDDPAHAAPASANLGALFLDTPSPAIKPAFADARCVDGTLVVTTMGDPERDLPSRILLWTMGPDNLHPIEFQLFYGNLRANAAERVAAWRRADLGPMQ